MVTSILNKNSRLSLERTGHQIIILLTNVEVHKSIDPGLNSYRNKNIHCFKIYPVSEKYLS